MATVFPGTTTIESDFSVLSYEFNGHRSASTEFSIEGIIQAKEHENFQSVYS
jgi:hypothetical protein